MRAQRVMAFLLLVCLLVACTPLLEEYPEAQVMTEALSSNNKELCFQVTQSDLCLALQGIANRDYLECESLSEPARGTCYLGIFYSTLDFQTCYGHPYASNVFLGTNLTKITNETVQENIHACNFLILGQNLDRTGVCDIRPKGAISSDNKEWDDYCLWIVDQIAKTEEDCDALEGVSRDNCLVTAAGTLDDPKVCSKIKDASIREDCEFQAAIYSSDLSLCPENERYPVCYAMVKSRK